MGYSAENRKITIYVEHPEGTFTKDISVYHIAAKYWGLYLGHDGHYAPFSGKFAFTTLRFGPGAYLPEPMEAPTILDTYTTGDNELIVHEAQDNDENFELVDVNYETSVYDFAYEENGVYTIDGVPEYGYGLWTKFLMTTPTRLMEKPEFI